jgi:hypothetical protein
MLFLGLEVRTATENNAKNVYAAEIRFQKSGVELKFRNQVNILYLSIRLQLLSKNIITIPSQCNSVQLMFINHFTTCFSHRWPSSGGKKLLPKYARIKLSINNEAATRTQTETQILRTYYRSQ